MPKASCPGCGRSIPFAMHEMELVIQCAQCNTRFTPAGGPLPDTSPVIAPTVAPVSIEFPRRQRSRSTPLVVALGSVLLLGAIVFLAAMSLSGKPEEAHIPVIAQRPAPAQNLSDLDATDQAMAPPSEQSPLPHVRPPEVEQKPSHSKTTPTPRDATIPATQDPARAREEMGLDPRRPPLSAVAAGVPPPITGPKLESLIRAYVTARANDPDSVQFVDWSVPKAIRPVSTNGQLATTIYATVRSKNRFGAKEVNEYAFVVKDDKVVGHARTDDKEAMMYLLNPTAQDFLRELQKNVPRQQ